MTKFCFLKKSSEEAAAECCARNMTLLAIESDAEFKCLERIIKHSM